MSNVLIQSSTMTAIADAIREKNGESTTYKPSEMVTAIQDISVGGTDIEDGLVTGTLSSYTNSRITSLKSGVFQYQQNLKHINCANLTTIPACEFMSCHSLTTISFDKVSLIYSSAFYSCEKLISINIPKAMYIYDHASEWSVAYGNGKYIFMGFNSDTPQCLSTSNWINWTTTTIPVDESWSCITCS